MSPFYEGISLTKATPKKVSVSTNIAQNFTAGRAGGLSFLQIFYRCPGTDSDVSDVDKKPCSMDKSDVYIHITDP